MCATLSPFLPQAALVSSFRASSHEFKRGTADPLHFWRFLMFSNAMIYFGGWWLIYFLQTYNRSFHRLFAYSFACYWDSFIDLNSVFESDSIYLHVVLTIMKDIINTFVDLAGLFGWISLIILFWHDNVLGSYWTIPKKH